MRFWTWLRSTAADGTPRLDHAPSYRVPMEPCYRVRARHPWTPERLQTGIPFASPGIYRMIDHEQGIDYVGATMNLWRKYREHAHNGLMQGAKEYRYAAVTAEVVERCTNDLAALRHLFCEIEEENLV